jgi:hypothetical protein
MGWDTNLTDGAVCVPSGRLAPALLDTSYDTLRLAGLMCHINYTLRLLFGVAKTGNHMIIDHADRLHVRINNRGAQKLKAAFL